MALAEHQHKTTLVEERVPIDNDQYTGERDVVMRFSVCECGYKKAVDLIREKGFKTDLKLGESFEKRVMDYMNKKHKFKHNQGNLEQLRKYDLICDCCKKTIECKVDRQRIRTKNVCFEIPTLQHSEADYWFWGQPHSKKAEWAESEPLKEYLRRYMKQHGTVKGGDFDYDLILVNEKELAEQDFVKSVIL